MEDVSVGREARYQFVHEQIRQTLIGTLSLPRRQRLHLRIADALEQASAAEVERNAGEIAVHLYQAGAAADSDAHGNEPVGGERPRDRRGGVRGRA